MFIAIVGTRSSGCSTVERYLVSAKGFTSIRLALPSEVEFRKIAGDGSDSSHNLSQFSDSHSRNGDRPKHRSFLTFDATPLSSPSPLFDNGQNENSNGDAPATPMVFKSPEEILDYATRNWRSNYVTTDLKTREAIEIFIKRPFFLLLSLDAPLLDRYRRSNSNDTFHTFIAEDDQRRFGKRGSLNEVADWINLRVVNDFPSMSAFYSYLDGLDLLNPSHLRPDWDMYFMTLASLASQRSNCMKRRVGAILVRDKRIVSTGYNGTPRGVRNCNEGGCPRCNSGSEVLSDNDECVCLHAEENALLEAGRERVGKGSVLYCNTCPCLKCTVKIIQTGVESVVYNLSYKVDTASAKLFAEAGIQLRRFDPSVAKNHVPISVQEENYDTSTLDMSASDEDSE